MRPGPKIATAVPLAAVAVLLTGCTDGAYSTNTVEQQLPGQLAGAGYVGMSVTCPQLVDKPGASATCTATDGSRSYRVTVTRNAAQDGWSWQLAS